VGAHDALDVVHAAGVESTGVATALVEDARARDGIPMCPSGALDRLHAPTGIAVQHARALVSIPMRALNAEHRVDAQPGAIMVAGGKGQDTSQSNES
jgi:hypothetical protein